MMARMEPTPPPPLLGEPPLAPPAGPDRRSNRRGVWIGGGAAAVIVAGLLGYFIGLHVGRNQASATVTSGTSATGGATAGQGGSRKVVTGAITAVDGTLVTLTDQNSGSKITIELTPLTMLRVLNYGTPANLKPGGNITVMGRRLSNGTVRARIVTVNPVGPAPVPGLTPATSTPAP